MTGMPPPPGWPAPLGRDAMLGVLGQIVREIAPHTEADPAAIAYSALAALGCMIGRGAWMTVEGTRHHARLYVALVGATAAGRKGTSLDRVLTLARELDADWTEHGRLSGLSSGEGLIHALRDGDGLEDPGVPDKRRLVIASELAGALRVIDRQGNTLSPVLRDAWDGSTLRTLTRASGGLCATEPHVAIIGHITEEELRRTLTATETANGLGNRYLWVATRRSQLLPEGGGEYRWPAPVTDWLRESVARARSLGELRRTSAARDAWRAVYMRHHSVERRGIYGSLAARGDAQMVRLGLLLAVLDQADAIEPEHIAGAAELWRYCEDTVRYTWGDASGDDVADRIVARLRDAGGAGLTRDQLRDAMSRHVPADRLARALRALADAGQIGRTTETTGGRPAERWRLRGGDPGVARVLPPIALAGARLAVRGVA